MDWNTILPWLIALGTIIWINLILSGDNAVVIGMAAHHLPGKLRKWAIFWGTVGAIAIRILLTGVAFYLLSIPLLQAAGGLLLLWIALKLVWEDDSEDEQVHRAQTLAHALRIIITADVIMSLDNVLAVAAAAQGHLDLLIIGLVTSMLIIMLGAALIVSLLNRAPWLNGVGAAVISYVGGEMIFKDSFFLENHWPVLSEERWHLIVPWAIAALVLLYSFWLTRKRNRVHHSPSATSMEPLDK